MQRNLLILLSAATLVANQASAQTLTTLYSFASEEGQPTISLIRDAASNVYGTTINGGAYGAGTVFKISPSGIRTVLHSFTGGSDGLFPGAGLIFDAAGNLYGATTVGGINDCGTVFQLSPSGTHTVLHRFAGGSNGCYPAASLIFDAAGNLYGTTALGGTNDFGTVFKISPSGTHAVLYPFAGGSDGANPFANLIADAAGNFYGTTTGGGINDCGTVFQLSPSGIHAVLHRFAGDSNGCYPAASVIADAAGNLYGTTAVGGINDRGTVFKVTPSGIHTVLYRFATDSDGSYPTTDPILDTAGNLYGTARLGGANSVGTVFKLSPLGTFTVLHSFTGSDGGYPGGLVFDAVGNLYGTTAIGVAGSGTVFKLTLPATQVTIASNPAGREFSVLGTGCTPGNYTAPQNFSWVPGTSCLVSLAPTQNGTAGAQYVFSNWTDSDTAISRTITAPASTVTYTANFKTQYELTSSVSPAGSGSVTGAGYYDAGSTATVVATANAGYQFLNWTGPTASPSSASTTVTMNVPVSVTANFQLTPKAQTITFNAIPAQVTGASVNLSTYANATSGLPVSFASLTTGVCTVSGTIASMTNAGICTIQASQAGNGTYAAATPVSKNITVSPLANFTIKANPPNQTAFRDVLAAFLLELKSVNGFNGNVKLSCSGGPVGAKCANLPQTVRANGTAYAISGMIFPKNTTPGTYTVTFTGVSGSLTNTATATFTVK